MRDSIIQFFKNTIVFKYTLPYGDIEKSIYTTIDNDFCFSNSNNDDFAKIIYESIIDYCFNESDFNDSENINDLQIEAISQRLRFEDEDSNTTKERYGFYGEVIFNLMLRILFKTTPIIAKGYFYDILKPEENKGYDSFHITKTQRSTCLWFGEVKFHQSYKTAIDSVFNNIEKAISNNYFRKNLLVITPRKSNLNISDDTINGLLNKLRHAPKTSIEELQSEFSLKLVYPILIICNPTIDYDTTIANIIEYIKKYSGKVIDIDINFDVFFILLPVADTKTIKQTVIKWIESSQPLTLL